MNRSSREFPKIKIGVLLMVLILTVPAFLQGKIFIYHDRPPYTSRDEIKSLFKKIKFIADSVVRRDRNTFYRAYILEARGDRYFLINGRNDVFRLDGKFDNISKSSFHGHNFKSKKFVRSDTLYSYGGYGFWRRHGDLIFFDWNRKEWEIKIIPGNYEGVKHWKTFQYDSLLYTFGGIRIVQGSGIEERDQALHRINLNELTHENLGIIAPDLRDLQTPHTFYETSDYLVFHRSGNKSFIIDKDSLEYKMTNITFEPDMTTDRYGLYHITGNDVKLYDSTGAVQGTIDVERAYQNMDGGPIPLLADTGRQWPVRILGVALFALIGVVLYYWLQREQKTAFDHPVIEELCDHDGDALTVEELDELFGIKDIRQDETKRARRASYINEVNMEYESKRGKKLINRERDPDDKRRFIYRIKC